MKKILLTSSLVALGVSQLAFSGEEMAPVVDISAPSSSPWTLGIEALYLKAHSNDSSIYDGQDEEFAYRVNLAYKSGDNLGIRLSYFDFEGTQHSSSSEFSEDGPDIGAIDLVLFDNFTLGSWQGEYSFGIRHVDFEEPFEDSLDSDFDGWGPTVGLELVRPISDRFSVYASAQVSLLFGDNDVNNDDSTASMIELALGIQYDFAMGDCESNIRLGIEAQDYQGLAYEDVEDDQAGAFGGVLGLNFSF